MVQSGVLEMAAAVGKDLRAVAGIEREEKAVETDDDMVRSVVVGIVEAAEIVEVKVDGRDQLEVAGILDVFPGTGFAEVRDNVGYIV